MAVQLFAQTIGPSYVLDGNTVHVELFMPETHGCSFDPDPDPDPDPGVGTSLPTGDPG